jgi:FkbM family methyltransferase
MKLIQLVHFLIARKIFYPLNMMLYKLSLLGLGCYVSDFAGGQIDLIKRASAACTDFVVFDIGANVGEYSKAVLANCSNARVFAFEPNPPAFKLLERTKNERLAVYNFGLGSSSQQSELFEYESSSGSGHATLYKNVIEKESGKPSKSEPVLIRKLDDVIEELAVERIHLLKIDTEGHELYVIQGAAAALKASKIDLIQFEFNRMNVTSRVFMQDFYDLLPDFEFFRILRDGWVPMGPYKASTHEIFVIHDVVAIRKPLVGII